LPIPLVHQGTAKVQGTVVPGVGGRGLTEKRPRLGLSSPASTSEGRGPADPVGAHEPQHLPPASAPGACGKRERAQRRRVRSSLRTALDYLHSIGGYVGAHEPQHMPRPRHGEPGDNETQTRRGSGGPSVQGTTRTGPTSEVVPCLAVGHTVESTQQQYSTIVYRGCAKGVPRAYPVQSECVGPIAVGGVLVESLGRLMISMASKGHFWRRKKRKVNRK